MMTVRRSHERQLEVREAAFGWHSFHGDPGTGSTSSAFGRLEGLDHYVLAGGAALERDWAGDAEVVTYVHEGVVVCQGSDRSTAVIHSGEFQHRAARGSARRVVKNASQAHHAAVFQIRLSLPAPALDLAAEQARFSVAQRRGHLCVIASPDARGGSLRMRQSAYIYSAVLDRGRHAIHALAPGRRTWLHVVRGSVAIHGLVLTAGDGIGLMGERALSFTACETAEVLLADLMDFELLE